MSIDYSNFAFPKPPKKEKTIKFLKKNKPINKVSNKRKKQQREDKKIYENKIRISDGKCDLCRKKKAIDIHHLVYGTANRKLSTKYNLLIHICEDCHKEIHTSLKEKSKRKGQEIFEKYYGSREDFIKIFGKNFLD